MTLFTYGDRTIVLEKVCAYSYDRPQQGAGGEPRGETSLQILLEGGHTLTLYSQVAISEFTKAVKVLSDRK